MIKRKDGLCPRCGLRPRVKGNRRPYCAECHREYQREYLKARPRRAKIVAPRKRKTLCSKCGQAPRVGYSNTMCYDCTAQYQREWRKARMAKKYGLAS